MGCGRKRRMQLGFALPVTAFLCPWDDYTMNAHRHTGTQARYMSCMSRKKEEAWSGRERGDHGLSILQW